MKNRNYENICHLSRCRCPLAHSYRDIKPCSPSRILNQLQKQKHFSFPIVCYANVGNSHYSLTSACKMSARWWHIARFSIMF